MRVRHAVVLAAGVCLLGALSGGPRAQGAGVDINAGGVHVEVGTQKPGEQGAVVRATDLIGLTVRSSDNDKEDLGRIEDLVVAPDSGRIRYAVLRVGGGFLGLGSEKYFAVPWDKLTFVAKGATGAGTANEAYCMLDVSKEALKKAPGFDKDHWPDFASRNWSTLIDEYYAKPAATVGARAGNRQ